MKFSASGGTEFKKVPAGTHVAVCNAIIDVGVQETNFGPKRQVYLRYEVPEERMDTEDGSRGGPMVIGKFYTASMNEKANLRTTIESWFGKKFPNDRAAEDFDMKNILGRPCQITVVHTEKAGKTYANISAVTGIPKGFKAPAAENELLLFEYGDDHAKLPEWLQKKLGSAVTEEASLQSAAHEYASTADDSEDPPF